VEIIDEGYLTLKLTDSEGKTHEVRLDLYEVDCAISEAIREAHREAGDRESALLVYRNVVQVFLDRGVPHISHGAAMKLVQAVREAVQAFKKKHLEPASPGSRGSTASTPGS